MKLETQLMKLNVDVAARVSVLLVKCESSEMNRGRQGRERRKQNREKGLENSQPVPTMKSGEGSFSPPGF